MSEEFVPENNKKCLIQIKFKLRPEFKNIPGLKKRIVTVAEVTYSAHVKAVLHQKDEASRINKGIAEIATSQAEKYRVVSVKKIV